MSENSTHTEKSKIIDVHDLKIISKPSFIIGLISVVSVVTLHIATFFNMKSDLSENTEIIKTINSKLDNQHLEFQKEIQKIHIINAKIEGNLEIIKKNTNNENH